MGKSGLDAVLGLLGESIIANMDRQEAKELAESEQYTHEQLFSEIFVVLQVLFDLPTGANYNHPNVHLIYNPATYMTVVGKGKTKRTVEKPFNPWHVEAEFANYPHGLSSKLHIKCGRLGKTSKHALFIFLRKLADALWEKVDGACLESV